MNGVDTILPRLRGRWMLREAEQTEGGPLHRFAVPLPRVAGEDKRSQP